MKKKGIRKTERAEDLTAVEAEKYKNAEENTEDKAVLLTKCPECIKMDKQTQKKAVRKGRREINILES